MIKNLNYECIGTGDVTIVLLHGWGLDKSAFDCVVSKVNPKVQILSLDFFGFGGADNPEDWFDTYEYAYYVFLLLKELKIKKAILVGHSFGGRIATILSSVFDLNIEYMILTSSAGIRCFSLFRWLKIKYYKMIKWFVKIGILNSQTLSKFGSDDYNNLNRVKKNVFIKIINQDLKYLLEYIDTKTYLVWDKKDNVTKHKECKVLHKKIKNNWVVLYKQGAHFAYMKNSHKFAELINNCIEKAL